MYRIESPRELRWLCDQLVPKIDHKLGSAQVGDVAVRKLRRVPLASEDTSVLPQPGVVGGNEPGVGDRPRGPRQ
jgi:hypothetical protein